MILLGSRSIKWINYQMICYIFMSLFTNINHSIMKYYSIKKVNINLIYYFCIHYQDFEQNTKLNLSRSYETPVIHLAVCCTYWTKLSKLSKPIILCYCVFLKWKTSPWLNLLHPWIKGVNVWKYNPHRT